MSDGPDNDGRRRIRSFVRRGGRLTRSQQRAMQALWPVFGVDAGDAPLDFDRLFGREAPRVLEIGFGNGDTLVALAASDPDRDYLGIEVHEPGVGHCLIRIRETGINNLRLIIQDALEVLRQRVPAASVDRVNLYFPDPWPKKRHHKRRIVQREFLDLVWRALTPGGTLHVATDWQPYAEVIDDVVAASALFACEERREHDGDDPLDRPVTKFERRGLRHGHRICDWRFVRIDPAAPA